jgi:hypothetical protein
MSLKVRAFIVGSQSRAAVPGARIILRAVEAGAGGKTVTVPLAEASADRLGYISVSLETPAGDVPEVVTKTIAAGLVDGCSDLQLMVQGDAKSTVGLLAARGVLGSMKPDPAANPPIVFDETAVAERAIAIRQALFGEAHATHLTTDAALLGDESAPGIILSPDPVDYALSPQSFVQNRPMTLGQGDCEHIVPSRLPEQRRMLYRLNLRHDIPADITRASPASNAETQLASVAGDLRPDPRLIFAELMVFEQTWTSLGHSLGEIQYSLALAPGEATKIAVVDWSRTDDISRKDVIRAREALLHDQTYDREVDDIVKGDVKEQQGGVSAMYGNAVAADFAIPKIGLSAAGRTAGGIGGSFTAGNRDMRADAQQDIHGGTLQRSSLRRNLTSTVVIQAGQAEQNYLSTRIVANMNRMHALTIQYYEVLRHLAVVTTFRNREWALLVPFLPFAYTRDLARRFRVQLEPNLLDPRRAPGFDALERLAIGDAAYDGAGAPAGGPASGGGMTPPPVVTSRVRCTLVMGPREQPAFAAGPDTPGSVVVEIGLKNGTRVALVQKSEGASNLFLNIKNPDGSSRATASAGMTTYVEERSEQFDPIQVASLAVRFTPSTKIGEDVNSGWDLDRVRVEIEVRGVWQPLFDWTGLPKFNIPPRLARPAEALTFPRRSDVIDLTVITPANVRSLNSALGSPIPLPPNDNQITLDHAAAVSNAYAAAGLTRTHASVVWPGPPPLSPPPSPTLPGDDMEDSAPDGPQLPTKAGDEALADLLVNHLNANAAYYNSWCWVAMDRSERRMRMALAAGRFADSLGDELLGVIGNHLVLRYVGPAMLNNDVPLPVLEGKAPPPSRSIVTLPTRGVFAEAHLGHCNGAEVRDVTRMWNFDELPVSLLPNIADLTMGPRGQSPTIGQGQLPATVVGIKDPPALPAPTGAAAVLTALGKGDTFRDMSGLDEVSKILGELIESADPPDLVKLLGAKEGVDKAAASAKAVEEVAKAAAKQPPESTALPTASADLSTIGKSLRLIDPLDVKLPQVLHDLEKAGGTDKVFPPKAPVTRKPTPPAASTTAIRFVPINAYGQKEEADISVMIEPSNGDFVPPMQTSWRAARRSGTSAGWDEQGYLPERIANLRDGALEVTVSMPPGTNQTPLVNGATATMRFAFPAGTGVAVFEIVQDHREDEVVVKAGDTLETTVAANASLAPSISATRNATAGGSIRALEVSAGTVVSGTLGLTGGGNWSEVKGKTWAQDKTFKVLVPLPTIKLRQISP